MCRIFAIFECTQLYFLLLQLKHQNIFIVSNEPWGETWFSKHNYAWELSKNNQVYFINPPIPFSPINWFQKCISVTAATNNLSILSYRNEFPVRIEWMRRLNEIIIFRKLNRYQRKHQLSAGIFWTFDPIRLTSPEKLNPAFILLHVVDKYRFKWKGEKILAEKANIILCVADEIASDYQQYAHKVTVVPHAIASDEILDKRKTRSDKITGIFVGNLDKRIDFEITSFLVERFPEVEFHFVGKIANDGCRSDLIFAKNYRNVFYHGEKPFKELKHYIHNADFCFLFKDNQLNGNNFSSHKMLQYFAQGKPIFSTELSRYQKIKHLLYMHNDKFQLAGMMETFIRYGESEKLVLERIEYAEKHSFKNILNQIELIIKDA